MKNTLLIILKGVMNSIKGATQPGSLTAICTSASFSQWRSGCPWKPDEENSQQECFTAASIAKWFRFRRWWLGPGQRKEALATRQVSKSPAGLVSWGRWSGKPNTPCLLLVLVSLPVSQTGDLPQRGDECLLIWWYRPPAHVKRVLDVKRAVEQKAFKRE